MRSIGIVALFFIGANLFAQTPSAPTGQVDVAPSPSAKFPSEWYSEQDPYHPMPDGGVVHTDAPVTGTPFTATIVASNQVSIPGRASMTARMRTIMMRDSAGRTRMEVLPFEMEGTSAAIQGDRVRKIEVNDVVTHCTFGWVESPSPGAEKTASVQCLPRTITVQADGMDSKMMRQTSETLHPFPWQTLQIEPLGEKQVAGVKAFGVRQTLTDTHASPAQPQVTEIWWSPEIKEIVLTKPIGELAGTTIEMTGIERKEPDAAFFYPPAGFKIVIGRPAE